MVDENEIEGDTGIPTYEEPCREPPDRRQHREDGSPNTVAANKRGRARTIRSSKILRPHRRRRVTFTTAI
jgi:hypothetical protein